MRCVMNTVYRNEAHRHKQTVQQAHSNGISSWIDCVSALGLFVRVTSDVDVAAAAAASAAEEKKVVCQAVYGHAHISQRVHM